MDTLVESTLGTIFIQTQCLKEGVYTKLAQGIFVGKRYFSIPLNESKYLFPLMHIMLPDSLILPLPSPKHISHVRDVQFHSEVVPAVKGHRCRGIEASELQPIELRLLAGVFRTVGMKARWALLGSEKSLSTVDGVRVAHILQDLQLEQEAGRRHEERNAGTHEVVQVVRENGVGKDDRRLKLGQNGGFPTLSTLLENSGEGAIISMCRASMCHV